MMKTIKNRIRSRRGLSLAEVLIAILLVLMMTSIAAAGMPAAVNAYRKVVDASNAQTFLSTTMTSMRNELSTAKIVEISESQNQIKYMDSGGVETTITSIVGGSMENGDGIYIKHSYDATSVLLVSKAAANKNLYAAFDSITYDSANSCVVVTGLSVFKDGTTSGPLVTIDKFDIRVIT